MAYSKYYTEFQPAGSKPDFSALMEKLKQQQQQQQQQSGSGLDNFSNAAKAYKYFKTPSSPVPSGGGNSFGGGNSVYGGIDIPTSTGGGTMPSGQSWYSAMMNPAVAVPAAIIAGANVMHNKDISSWGDTLKGKGGANLVDYYQGKKDGKEHGFMSKVLDPDGATGQLTKSLTDFGSLDFSNGFKGVEDGLKSLFKLKLF
jgi:hypothetical protein